jgi:hypothetical protein
MLKLRVSKHHATSGFRHDVLSSEVQVVVFLRTSAKNLVNRSLGALLNAKYIATLLTAKRQDRPASLLVKFRYFSMRSLNGYCNKEGSYEDGSSSEESSSGKESRSNEDCSDQGYTEAD